MEDKPKLWPAIKKDIDRSLAQLGACLGGCALGLFYLGLAATGLLIFVAVVIWAWRMVFG